MEGKIKIMVQVTNLKEKLRGKFNTTTGFKGDWTSGHFVHKDDKEQVWSYYLNDEAQYLNGGIYVHTTPMPTYHLQSFRSIFFEVYDDNNIDFTVFVNSDKNFIQEQLDSIETYLNNQSKIFTRELVDNGNFYGMKLRVPTTTEGEIKLVIPPYNIRNPDTSQVEMYSGIQREWTCKSQNLTITNTVRQNNKLTLTVKITNPVKGQELKLTTFYRNGNSHYFEVMELPSNNSTQSITVDCASGDVKYELKLISYQNPNTKYYHLGKSITNNL